eukprot:TRINITY_DN392_c0_g1_i3.p1 TRINITY_DN392_c0_g1~~TRINITY_DN392_c0_g1_i3.p1  ORF type:complete len:209 (-),score=38.70 TRINITY_DN392_c0_g1_i3:98-724(-)
MVYILIQVIDTYKYIVAVNLTILCILYSNNRRKTVNLMETPRDELSVLSFSTPTPSQNLSPRSNNPFVNHVHPNVESDVLRDRISPRTSPRGPRPSPREAFVPVNLSPRANVERAKSPVAGSSPGSSPRNTIVLPPINNRNGGTVQRNNGNHIPHIIAPLKLSPRGRPVTVQGYSETDNSDGMEIEDGPGTLPHFKELVNSVDSMEME